MRNSVILFLTVSLVVLSGFYGCNKPLKINEEADLVKVQKFKVPTDYNVAVIDFVNENVGFVMCVRNSGNYNPGTHQVFKTTNGGVTWTNMNFPYTDQEFRGMVALDEDNILVAWKNTIVKYQNGTWSFTGLSETVKSVGRDGSIGYMIIDQTMVNKSKLYRWNTASATWTNMGEFFDGHENITCGRLCDSMYYFYLNDATWEDDYIRLNINTMVVDSVHFSDYGYSQFEVVGRGNDMAYCLGDGKIAYTHKGIEGYYNYHELDYYSIDYVGDRIVAVGNRTVSVFDKNEWREALTQDKESINAPLYCVRAKNENACYAGGADGSFYLIEF